MSDHASRSHKRFAASAASRWMTCPGSIKLSETVPEPPPSQYALEGTRAHEILESALNKKYVDHKAHSSETMEAVEVAFEHIRSIETSCSTSHYETQLTVPGMPDVGGTADFTGHDLKGDIAHVVDFKYGSGVVVEAVGNKQMRVYALGILAGWQPKQITMTIIQPRAYHPDGPIRSETITREELLDFRLDVEMAVAAALEDDPPFVPSDECRWCPAKAVCPAIEKKALTAMSKDFGHVRDITPVTLPDPKTLNPERLGAILAAQSLVEGWFAGIAEEAYKQAMSGVKIPGHKLVVAGSRRKWEGDPKQVAAKLAELAFASPSDFLEECVIGITDAEKRIKAGLRDVGANNKDVEETMKQMAFLTTKSSSGKLQLVPESDRRPATDPAAVAFHGVDLPHIE